MPRKCLRSSAIIKSENNVKGIVNVLKNDFINPFSADLDHYKLYNFASGNCVTDDVAESLWTVQKCGTWLRDDFFERLHSECSIKDFFQSHKTS